MNREEIKEKLIALVAVIFQNFDVDMDLLEYVDFEDDLGMDSITFITLIVEIEEHFGIVVPDEIILMENFKTIADVTRIVAQCLCEQGGGKSV